VLIKYWRISKAIENTKMVKLGLISKIIQTMNLKNFLPDGLLACESQRKIDPLKSHPINFLLPSFPIPPGKWIFEFKFKENYSKVFA
jgi:hypothetical protein